jgi:hypothetical protein
VSLTETAGIEEWRLVVAEAKAHLELQPRGRKNGSKLLTENKKFQKKSQHYKTCVKISIYSKLLLIRNNWGRSSGLVKQKVAIKVKKSEYK